MPRKRKSRCSFIDCEAAEEDDEGNVVHHHSDDEEDSDAYESDFVDDSEPVVVRREKVRLAEDEYEIDEDDWLLLRDNARANRQYRITRAESSDSDSFIDDDGSFEHVAVDPPDELFDDEVLNTLVELAKEQAGTVLEERKAAEPAAAAPAEAPAPAPIVPPRPILRSMFMELEDDVMRRRSGPTWADFHFKQADPKKKPRSKKAPPAKCVPKLEPGLVRTSEGMFLVTSTGKRIRMTEEGSVKH